MALGPILSAIASGFRRLTGTSRRYQHPETGASISRRQYDKLRAEAAARKERADEAAKAKAKAGAQKYHAERRAFVEDYNKKHPKKPITIKQAGENPAFKLQREYDKQQAGGKRVKSFSKNNLGFKTEKQARVAYDRIKHKPVGGFHRVKSHRPNGK